MCTLRPGGGVAAMMMKVVGCVLSVASSCEVGSLLRARRSMSMPTMANGKGVRWVGRDIAMRYVGTGSKKGESRSEGDVWGLLSQQNDGRLNQHKGMAGIDCVAGKRHSPPPTTTLYHYCWNNTSRVSMIKIAIVAIVQFDPIQNCLKS